MSVSKSEAERKPAPQTNLVKHYGAIGPAAVLAAVLAAKKHKPALALGKVA